MLVAYDVTQTQEYTLRKEANIANKTVFVLGVLDSGLAAHLDDSGVTFNKPQDSKANAEVKIHTNTKNREIVRFGLKGVKNFKDSKGKDIVLTTEQFSTPIGLRQGITDASIDYVKPWIDELAEEIQKENTITDEERKN